MKKGVKKYNDKIYIMRTKKLKNTIRKTIKHNKRGKKIR